MKMNRMLRRPLLALSAGVVATVMLTGCANPLEKAIEGLVERGVEQIVEGATGGEIQVGGMTGSADVPSDFPASVPLPGGQPNHALRVVTDGTAAWTLHYTATSDDYDRIVAAVVAAGFAEESSGEFGDAMKMAQFSDDTYRLSVSLIGADDDERMLQYLVVERSD